MDDKEISVIVDIISTIVSVNFYYQKPLPGLSILTPEGNILTNILNEWFKQVRDDLSEIFILPLTLSSRSTCINLIKVNIGILKDRLEQSHLNPLTVEIISSNYVILPYPKFTTSIKIVISKNVNCEFLLIPVGPYPTDKDKVYVHNRNYTHDISLCW